MKKKAPKPTFSDAVNNWIEAHRPTLFHPEKSWVKYGALKATKGVYKLARAGVRETYYAATPERLPDARTETTEELWHLVAETPEVDTALVVDEIVKKIATPLSIYRPLIEALIVPEVTPPPFPENADAIGHARWRDAARRFLTMYHFGSIDEAAKPILAAIERISAYLPPPSKSELRIPIKDLIPDLPKVVQDVIQGFYTAYTVENGLYAGLRNRFERNTIDEKGNPVLPLQSKLEPAEIPAAYLKDTPLLTLFNARISFGISDEKRFAHTWLLAGSGHGKTTYLTNLLNADIERIRKGEATAIVFDSQNDTLFPPLLKVDVPKVIIDPTDVEFPIALNLFDIGLDKVTDQKERDALLTNAIDMFEFVLSALLDQEMTTRQSTLFGYLSELLITQIPNALIWDFRNLLDLERSKAYAKYWQKLPPETRDYFETDFLTNHEVKATRQQVLTRLRTLLRMKPFINMFSAPKTKIDLLAEMDAGKLILVNTDKAFLSAAGTKLFGRFWIAQITLAAQKRAKSTKKTPTFVYIDEAQDYLEGGDPKVTTILDQARKQNVGLMVIHHYTSQLKSERLLEALSANTTTKLAGSLEIGDEKRFSQMMRTTPEFISSQQPAKSLACYVRGVTSTAISLTFPKAEFKQQLSDLQFSVIRDQNRAKYCSPVSSSAPQGGKPESPPDTPDDGPTGPAKGY